MVLFAQWARIITIIIIMGMLCFSHEIQRRRPKDTWVEDDGEKKERGEEGGREGFFPRMTIIKTTKLKNDL